MKKQLLREMQHNKLLWLLVFVPLMLLREIVGQRRHVRFVLSVLAIVPAGELLSGATKSVAAKRQRRHRRPAQRHAGNLTELVIAPVRAVERRAVHAGESVTARCDCDQFAVHARHGLLEAD